MRGWRHEGSSDRRTRRIAVLVALALLVPTAVEASPAARPGTTAGSDQAQAGDLLPDMRLEPLYGLTIRTTKKGRKRLRFGTRAFNVGAGPMEVRGSGPNNGVMDLLEQWIADDQGGGRLVAPPAGDMFWAGDGHAHWHIEQFINVELFKKGSLGSTRLIRKIGFCLLDLVRSSDPPPNTPPEARYRYDACGTNAAPSGGVTMGISVGYADDYQPLIAHQWIDISRLPKGIYRLCAKVNPLGHWVEADTTNNFFWHEIRVNAARSVVNIRRSGRTPCGSYRTT